MNGIKQQFKPTFSSLDSSFGPVGTYSNHVQNSLFSGIPNISTNSTQFNPGSLSNSFTYSSGFAAGSSSSNALYKQDQTKFTPKSDLSYGKESIPLTQASSLRNGVPTAGPSGIFNTGRSGTAETSFINEPLSSFKENTSTFTPKHEISYGNQSIFGKSSSSSLGKENVPSAGPSGTFAKNSYQEFALGNNGNPVNSFFSKNSTYKPYNRPTNLSSSGKGVTFAKTADGPRTFGLQFGSTPQGLSKLWDLQESKIASNAAKMAQATNKTAQVATKATAGVTGAVGSMAGPVGMAAAVSQQIGSGINDAMSSAENAQSKADYSNNINARGLDSGNQANIIHNQQQADISHRNTAGAIGSLFGPIGALAGHALGSIKFDSNLLRTTGSLNGRIDGSDLGVAAAHNSSAANGNSDIQQNVSN